MPVSKTNLFIWGMAITAAVTFTSGISKAAELDGPPPADKQATIPDLTDLQAYAMFSAPDELIDPTTQHFQYSDGLPINQYRTRVKYNDTVGLYYDDSALHGCFVLYRDGDSKNYYSHNNQVVEDTLETPVMYDSQWGLLFRFVRNDSIQGFEKEVIFNKAPSKVLFVDNNGKIINGEDKRLKLINGSEALVDENCEKYVPKAMIDKKNKEASKLIDFMLERAAQEKAYRRR